MSYFLFVQSRLGLVASVSVCFAATFALLSLFICYNTDFGTFAWPLLFFSLSYAMRRPLLFFITPTHNKMYSNQLDMSKGVGWGAERERDFIMGICHKQYILFERLKCLLIIHEKKPPHGAHILLYKFGYRIVNAPVSCRLFYLFFIFPMK